MATLAPLLLNRTYLRRILRRATVFWAAVRALLLAFSLGAGTGAALPPVSAFIMTVAVGVLCAADARFMRESLFHANLGVPPAAAGAAGVGVAAAAWVMERIVAAAAAGLA